jgi:predicted metal-dependent hydrolase
VTSQLPLFVAQDRHDTWTVRTSRRARRLSVRVYPGGRVEIVAPPGASAAVVQRFIGEHRRWIDDRVRDFAARTTVTTELPTVIDLPGIGRGYRLEYAAREGSARVQKLDDELLMVSGVLTNQHAIAKALRRWLADVATERLGHQLRGVADEFDFDYSRVQIRRQRTRWGSCSMSGTISLNVCLSFLDPALVRYLMIHELCHTRQMNHSARFWSLVAACEPGYRPLDRALTRSWQQVPWWMFG